MVPSRPYTAERVVPGALAASRSMRVLPRIRRFLLRELERGLRGGAGTIRRPVPARAGVGGAGGGGCEVRWGDTSLTRDAQISYLAYIRV